MIWPCRFLSLSTSPVVYLCISIFVAAFLGRAQQEASPEMPYRLGVIAGCRGIMNPHCNGQRPGFIPVHVTSVFCSLCSVRNKTRPAAKLSRFRVGGRLAPQMQNTKETSTAEGGELHDPESGKLHDIAD